MRNLRLLASVVALFTALVALPARASIDYTDIWWSAGGAESGWGVNLAQNANTIFATFYVYDTAGRPVWYTALLNHTVGETFVGSVYASSGGAWFGSPNWVAPATVAVGTATLVGQTPYRALFEYTIDSVPVSKTIDRTTLAALNISGTYLGANAGGYSGNCTSSTFLETRQVIVSQTGTPGTVTIDFLDSVSPFTLLCRMQGPASQFGRVITMPSASYICTGFPTIAVNVESIRPLDDGLEIHWEANDNGCIERGRAAAVRQ